jgi:hypothetical protein
MLQISLVYHSMGLSICASEDFCPHPLAPSPTGEGEPEGNRRGTGAKLLLPLPWERAGVRAKIPATHLNPQISLRQNRRLGAIA